MATDVDEPHEPPSKHPLVRCLQLLVMGICYIPLVLFWLVLAWCTVGWIPTLVWALIRHGQNKHVNPSTCKERITITGGFGGLPDFYGLGIRLGMYLQWAASIIATFLIPSERRTAAGANAALSLAMFIAILLIIFQDGCVFTAELVTLLYILWRGYTVVMLPFLSNGEFFGETPSDEHRGSLNLIAFAGFILYYPMSIWFWFRAATQGEVDFASSPHGTSFFLFAHIGPDTFHAAAIAMTVLMFWGLLVPAALFYQMISRKPWGRDRVFMFLWLASPAGIGSMLYVAVLKALRFIMFRAMRRLVMIKINWLQELLLHGLEVRLTRGDRFRL
jgi:hypothetical protein